MDSEISISISHQNDFLTHLFPLLGRIYTPFFHTIYHSLAPATLQVKMVNLFSSLLLTIALSSTFASAQLSGPVGPTTSLAQKAAVKICNVLDFGAKADSSTDIGAALTAAWASCKTGGIIYIPPGTVSDYDHLIENKDGEMKIMLTTPPLHSTPWQHRPI